MNDVAVAEGDAEKGEIVVSFTAHALLHSHSVNCGCIAMPSGCFKIQSSLDDMLAPRSASTISGQENSKDKDGGKVLQNSEIANLQSLRIDVDEEENNDGVDWQFEFEIYAQVIEELMSGYKAISSLLLEKFSELVNSWNITPTKGI